MAYENKYKRKSSKLSSETYADSILPEPSDLRELHIVENEIKWNAWMNVLGRCPLCEEDGALREIELLNTKYIDLITE